MSDETTMLPCPFCGGEARVERIGKSGYLYVACNTAYCCDFGKFDTEAEAIAAWNTRAATIIGKVQVEVEPVLHGTLTVEQVHDAVLENFEETYETSYDHWEPSRFDWQAIADGLNAELVSGTSRITASSTDGLCSDDPRQRFELSCGHSFTLDGLGAPVACPVCGKAVER